MVLYKEPLKKNLNLSFRTKLDKLKLWEAHTCDLKTSKGLVIKELVTAD